MTRTRLEHSRPLRERQWTEKLAQDRTTVQWVRRTGLNANDTERRHTNFGWPFLRCKKLRREMTDIFLKRRKGKGDREKALQALSMYIN